MNVENIYFSNVNKNINQIFHEFINEFFTFQRNFWVFLSFHLSFFYNCSSIRLSFSFWKSKLLQLWSYYSKHQFSLSHLLSFHSSSRFARKQMKFQLSLISMMNVISQRYFQRQNRMHRNSLFREMQKSHKSIQKSWCRRKRQMFDMNEREFKRKCFSNAWKMLI